MSDLDWRSICDGELQGLTLSCLPPTLQLPALPHAVTHFMQKANQPDAKVRELASIVETDSGLTLELLRHVNSAFVGLRHKATSIERALTLLGLRQSKLFLVQTGTQAAVRARKSKMINQNQFWNESLQRAIFAKEVAKILKADLDMSFAGALLQDFLLPVLTDEFIEGYVAFLEARDNQPQPLCHFERSQFTWNHPQVSAALAQRWHLPDELVCCLLFHHHGLKILTDAQLKRTSVAAVALSALLPGQMSQQPNGWDQLLYLQQKWDTFDLAAIAESVDAQHEELGMGVKNDFPLARRCRESVPAS